MKNYLFIALLLITTQLSFAQDKTFETVIDLDALDVISQGNSGTCWSFSTSSFLESEVKRITGKTVDLSEMYNVRHTYPKKAWIYVMRQGKAQFSEGGLAHDVINSIEDYGFVPNSVYSGLLNEEKKHNHSGLIGEIKPILDAYIKEKNKDWKKSINTVLDNKLGKDVTNFIYDDVNYTPKSFMESLKIEPKNYVSLTSFTHAPFYSNFVLNIPDNFSNGSFYNVTIDDMVTTVNEALKNGYTVELDCDVSEKTFSSKHGLAMVPNDDSITNVKKIDTEKTISQDYRQREFENYNTTDDHLMHITGLVKDQDGKTYYKVKNSWGNDNRYIGNNGYIYMSEAYFKLKTISVLLHKDGINKRLKNKLNL